MTRLETRFGLGTLLAALGGALVGAGLVLVRAGVTLEELGWLARLFAPAGKEHVIEGAALVTAGLLLVLLSAARPRRGRRRR
jgi:hypothetical protein